MNLRFYIRVLRSYAYYHLGYPKPLLVGMRITGKCNLDCDFCDVKKCNGEEMGTKKVLHTIGSLDRMRVAYLTLTGGEPLVRKDFSTMSRALGKSGLFVSLNTNATLITEDNAGVIAHNYDIVRISIDGDKRTHDGIRGKKGAYKEAMRGVRRLLRKRNRKCRICLNFVTTPKNINCMESVVQEWKKLVDSFSFMPVSHYQKGKSIIYSSREFMHKFSRMRRITNINQAPEFMFPQKEVGKNNCDAARLYYHIMPDGKVTPCSNLLYGCVLGDLKKESIDRVIKKRLSRGNIEAIRQCKGCFSRCTTEVSILMRKKPHKLICDSHRLIKRYGF